MSDAKPRRQPRNKPALGADQSHAVHEANISTTDKNEQPSIISLHHASVAHDIDMDLAARIRRARKRKKLTQVDLAKILDVKQSSISQWESNQTVPELENRIKLAEALSVSLNYLLPEARGVPSSALNETQVLRLIELFLKIRPEGRLAVLLLLEQAARVLESEPSPDRAP